MENLEKEIINRLNKVLNKYNLAIVSKNNHNYKTTISIDNTFKNYCYKYVLVEIYTEVDNDITIIECYHTWDNIESMLLSSAHDLSIFKSINIAHEHVKQHNIMDLKPYDPYLVLDNVYNELGFLNNCFSYEELAIKMDLTGI